jgi:hypothetical protein
VYEYSIIYFTNPILMDIYFEQLLMEVPWQRSCGDEAGFSKEKHNKPQRPKAGKNSTLEFLN